MLQGMLVLSRRIDEVITVGDDIKIVCVDIRGDRVRLGIIAPKSIPVHRQEVYDAIQREQGIVRVPAHDAYVPRGVKALALPPLRRLPLSQHEEWEEGW